MPARKTARRNISKGKEARDDTIFSRVSTKSFKKVCEVSVWAEQKKMAAV